MVVVSAYMGGTCGAGVLSSADGVCDMCMRLARGGRYWGREDWVWALPILEEHGETGICVCVLVAVVWVRLGESERLGQGLVGWSGVMFVCVVSLDSPC